MDSVFDEVIGLIKNDRSEGDLPKFRNRLVTYPKPKSPQKAPKNYSIETYVEHKGQLILIEKWQLCTEDIELDGSSKKAETKNNNNPGLSLTLFLQALKSTLHFSAVTSLKSQKLGIKIKTREWAGNSDMYENHFQFKSEEKKLPVVNLDNCQVLSVYLRTIQRSVVTWLVDHLQGRQHVSQPPPSPTQIAPIDELTSISLDSGFLSDSKDELEASESFSPPTKQLKFNEKPSVRTLLTSPPIERQLKFIPVTTSVRLPFTFPTIRRNYSRPLLSNFEESMLHERFPCVGILEGYTIDMGAMGSFCPAHVKEKIVVRHFSTDTMASVPSPYLGILKVPRSSPCTKRGYQIPRQGNLQLTLFNPEGSVVRIFSIPYNFSDMPPQSKSMLRQRITLNSTNKLKYLVHFRVSSSKSGKVFIQGEIRLLFNTIFNDSNETDDFTTKIEHPLPKFSIQSHRPTHRMKSLSTSDATSPYPL